jgi:eukaryotic-like serine/threonine-protein kinase
MIGSTLSHYRIIEKLGAGGMGEVYLADDLSLNRKVALKFLPDAFAGNLERMARFEREAKLLASLNHPNIAAIHGLEEAEGKRFLVLELVEGETLADLLKRGPIRVEEALQIALQIAEALEVAHEKGIIHRDLKPANIEVTPDGKVKVLDFGLAKAYVGEQADLNPLNSPTRSMAATQRGIILGTAAYMPPEQARGETVNKRADVWAFGCVLFEMLTGRAAFEGRTMSDVLASVIKSEPEWSRLPPNLHLRIRLLLERCLEKDARNRYSSISDARTDIQKALSVPGGIFAPPMPAREFRSKLRTILPWVAATAILCAIAAGVVFQRMKPPEPALARLSVMAPEGGVLTTDMPSAAISPNGRWLVFSATDSAGTVRLWIRPLDSVTAQPLSGTEDAILPFWSPDSSYIGFFADRKLRKVPASSGQPETICDAPNGRGGTWSKDGVIIFAPLATGPLQRVSANGGEVITVVSPDPARGETALRFPCFLPDGRHFLYVSLPRRQDGFDIYAGALDSKENERIMTADSAPVYAEPGYLLFARGGRLAAQRFDMSNLKPVGEAISLGDSPPRSSAEGGPALCPPAAGALAQLAQRLPNTQLIWLDRSGQPSSTIQMPPGRYEYPSLSPDRRLAAVIRPANASTYDLWVVDLERGIPSRLTFDGSVANGGPYPWSPDGTRIAFQCNQTGPYDIYQVPASGTGQPEPLYRSDVVLKYPFAWSSDGKYLIFGQDDKATGWDVWLLPLDGERKPVPYLRTPFQEAGANISPDGRWLAYTSDETGTLEVYVSSFPEPREKHRITTSGGSGAQWSRDGRELLIYTGGPTSGSFGTLLSVEVETTPTFKARAPRVLFTLQQETLGFVATGDLKRFLAAVPVEKAVPASITVVLNWQAALKR